VSDVFRDKVLVTVTVIDLADSARQLYGENADYIAGRKLPEHDYRFSAQTPTGGEISFAEGTTAADIAAYWRREGWLS
jgi:TPP-dependent pyruvate/acetoin dehydrogenase alpha subunit